MKGDNMGEKKRKIGYERAALEILLLKSGDIVTSSPFDGGDVGDDDWTKPSGS